MSLVLVQASTMSVLKEASTAPRRAAWRAEGVAGASVVRTASIVAMAGASIAAPFAMPPTRVPSPAGAVACLVTVSVVSMAWLARRPAVSSAASAAAAAGMPASSAAMGSGMPMRPVEQTSTSVGAQPSAAAVAAHMRRASSRPGSPVAALALPELRTTAAACPSARCWRLIWTGAAVARLVVNTPAAGTGRRSAVATRARSGSPFALTPQATPAASKPGTAVTLTA